MRLSIRFTFLFPSLAWVEFSSIISSACFRCFWTIIFFHIATFKVLVNRFKGKDDNLNSKHFECSDMKKTRVSTGLFQTGTIWNNPRTTLFVLEDVFQSSQLQNITVFLCTLYKMKKFRFYPLSCAHDRVFLNSPRRSPKRKKLSKDRGVSADLIPALGAFRVKNQTYAATTTPPRSRL